MNLEQICFIIKLLGSALIIAGCTGFGFHKSGQMTERLLWLKELYRLLVLLRGEIQYAATPVPEAMYKMAVHTNGIFREFFEAVSGQLYVRSGETLSEVWRQQSDIFFGESALKPEDIRLLKEIGDNLGYSDKKMQVSAMELCMDNLSMSIGTLEQNTPQKKRVCQCLGIFAGIFSVIILV